MFYPSNLAPLYTKSYNRGQRDYGAATLRYLKSQNIDNFFGKFLFCNNSFFFFFLTLNFKLLFLIFIFNLILYTWKIINFFWFLTFKRCFWKGFSWSKVISIRMKSNGIGMIRNKFYIFLYLWLREKTTFIIHRIQYSILIFNFLSSSSNKNYIIP